jgi:hypothetical protein
VITSLPDAPLVGPNSLVSGGGSVYEWLPTVRVRELLRRGPVAVWESGLPGTPASQSDAASALPHTRAADAFASGLNNRSTHLNYVGPSPPQGSLVVLHQHSSGGWQAIVDGVPLASYPADGFAQGWIVDRAGTLAVRYAAPPIALLWSIVFCALVAAIAMVFIRPKSGAFD